jgi:hypothetical protein
VLRAHEPEILAEDFEQRVVDRRKALALLPVHPEPDPLFLHLDRSWRPF